MESNEMEVPQPLPTTNLEQLERLAIEQSLTQHNGNRTHAAKALGVSVRTVERKLRRYALAVPAPMSGVAK